MVQNRNLEGADLVLWHTFGLTHIARIEDFPVMPVAMCGFMLRPHNFFSLNPGQDVPRSRNLASVGHGKKAPAEDACPSCPKDTPKARGVAPLSRL